MSLLGIVIVLECEILLFGRSLFETGLCDTGSRLYEISGWCCERDGGLVRVVLEAFV